MILLCGTENLDAKMRLKQALDNAGFAASVFADATLFDTCARLKEGGTLFMLNSPSIPIDNKMALKVAYAMLRECPIIMNTPLSYAADVNLFLRELLDQRINKFILCSYEILDDQDLRELVKNIDGAPTKYTLSKHEATLINSYLKAQFRV